MQRKASCKSRAMRAVSSAVMSRETALSFNAKWRLSGISTRRATIRDRPRAERYEGAERASFQPVKQLRSEPTTCQPRNSLRKKQGTCWNKQLKDDH